MEADEIMRDYKKRKCHSTNTFRDTAFRKNLFFFDFCPKIATLKKKQSINCMIDRPTPKFSTDNLK